MSVSRRVLTSVFASCSTTSNSRTASLPSFFGTFSSSRATPTSTCRSSSSCIYNVSQRTSGWSWRPPRASRLRNRPNWLTGYSTLALPSPTCPPPALRSTLFLPPHLSPVWRLCRRTWPVSTSRPDHVPGVVGALSIAATSLALANVLRLLAEQPQPTACATITAVSALTPGTADRLAAISRETARPASSRGLLRWPPTPQPPASFY